MNSLSLRDCFVLMTALLLCTPMSVAVAETSKPIVSDDLVIAEKNGMVAVEAEHFFKQELTDKRAFHLTHSVKTPEVRLVPSVVVLNRPKGTPYVRPDGDPSHVAGASGGAYLEVLPDTRRTHDDKLIKGENFSNDPGKMAVLSYKVHFETAGRYFVWVRAYSSGSEDNGLHVGIDGTWPESGQRMQWCQGKNSWRWESKQRTQKNHCGEPHKIFLDVAKPGEHTIHFSMREDGFEFDKWLMTTDREFKRPTGLGPATSYHAGKPPKAFAFVRPKFPAHWGKPPAIQTRDYRPLPGGYGFGSSTLAKWIQKNLDADKKKTIAQPEANDQRKGPKKVEPRKPDGKGDIAISGEQKQWHKVTLTLDGPFAHEQDKEPNPFTDYRLIVEFTNGDTTLNVPGYFAADGNAANTSAESGSKWRAHLAPTKTGTWTYKVSFRSGNDVALSDDPKAGQPVASCDGKTGSFEVAETDKTGRDLRAKGLLQYVGKHHLQFAGTGEFFLKAGADAPENFLAYAEFDGNFKNDGQKDNLIKTWQPHVKDWKDSDPTWQDGNGKGIIGAVNYLASQGMNVFSFLTLNIGGDDRNVFMYPDDKDPFRIDCSRMDQWAIVFEHGNNKGMYLHFKTQEAENTALLDEGKLGPQRKLYYRELIARFSHNLALNWNLGEEVGLGFKPKTQDKKDWAEYFWTHDPYQHHIVIHNGSNHYDLLGPDSKLTGFSLQTNQPDFSRVHSQTLNYLRRSVDAGKPWVVACDEPGDAQHSLVTDAEDPTHDNARMNALWGNIMAGGAGVEWYFGYKHPESDLTCQDYRSRANMWTQCRYALEFFADNKIPFWDMTNANKLVTTKEAYCLQQKNELFLVYLKKADDRVGLNVKPNGQYSIQWFNPRAGGKLSPMKNDSANSLGLLYLGSPPSDAGKDWLAVVKAVK